MKGWIVLDIDGTTTSNPFAIPEEVTMFLKEKVSQGWRLVFMTGRPFSFSKGVLTPFDFPYFLGVQNGADVLEMPTCRLFCQHYLIKTAIDHVEAAYGEKATKDYLVYSGYERGDYCYYRPGVASSHLFAYLEKAEKLSAVPWKALPNFEFEASRRFPLIKCLGNYEEMCTIEEKLQKHTDLAKTVIHDPLFAGLFLTLVTDKKATKGEAVKSIVEEFKRRNPHEKQGPIVVAGDDLNDMSMLLCADVRIVMETAPESLKRIAHVVAPAATKQGIIRALSQVL